LRLLSSKLFVAIYKVARAAESDGADDLGRALRMTDESPMNVPRTLAMKSPRNSGRIDAVADL